MNIEDAENKRDRTTIRTDMGTRESIKRLALQQGMTQEQFLKWMTAQMEASLQSHVDHAEEAVYHTPQAVDQEITPVYQNASLVYHDPTGIPPSEAHHSVESGALLTDEVTNQDLLLEIKSLKRVVYRVIKELCRITDADVNDPDSGITMQTKYDDRMLFPEKYRKKN